MWDFPVRYFWVLLWGYLDDHGRGVDDARLVKADCFPLDDESSPFPVSRASVEQWLEVMATVYEPGDDAEPALCRYTVKGRRYIHAPRWWGHQRPQHPKDSELPPCPFHDLHETSRDPHEDPPRASGSLHEDRSPEVEVEVEVEGGGVDGLRPSGALASLAPPGPAPAPPINGKHDPLPGMSLDPDPPPAGVKPKPPRRAARVPEDFTPDEAMRNWARENAPACTMTDHESFMDYWRGVAGAKGTKHDWPATWRNWMRREQQRRASNGHVPVARNGSGVVVHNGAHLKPETAQRLADRAWFAAMDAANGSGQLAIDGGALP
jgi:hypothetical protein